MHDKRLDFRKDVYLVTYNCSIITDVIAKTVSNKDVWIVNTTTYMNVDTYNSNDKLVITLDTDGDPIKVDYPITHPLDEIEVIFTVPKVSLLYLLVWNVAHFNVSVFIPL